MSYGEWLRVQLEQRQISQRAVAVRAGIDHSTVSRILRTARNPSLRTIGRLANVVGWPPPEVMAAQSSRSMVR